MNLLGRRTVRILSIDGGGIRGLIPALILRELRNRLQTRGHFTSFADQFDLISGTSAGALVALGLVVPARRGESTGRSAAGRGNGTGEKGPAAPRQSGSDPGPTGDDDPPAEGAGDASRRTPYLLRSESALTEGASAGGLLRRVVGGGERPVYERRPALDIDDIIGLYTGRGTEIFPRHRFNSLRTVVQAFADKYESAGLERVLSEVFGEATVRDALTNVLITSYDTERMEPFFFKKRPRRKGWEGDLNFYMRDAARASSAAPTYFEPAYVAPVPTDGEAPSGKRYCLIDGGVFANNPAMCAYVEARKIFPHAKRYVLVSLSTGRTMSSFPYNEVRSWGFIDWIRPGRGTPLATIMSSGQSECANHQLDKLPGVDFFRIEGELLPGRDEIDDASEENIRNLTLIAERMIHTKGEILDRICEELG